MLSLPTKEELGRLMRLHNISASRLVAETKVSGGTISKILHRSEYDPGYATMKALFDAVYAIIGERTRTAEDLLVSKSRKFPRIPPVTAVKATEPVRSIVETMKSTGYSQLPVVVNGKVVGMVSIRSLLDHPNALVATQALVYDYALIEPTLARSQAKELVKRVRALFVMGRDGKLKGVLTPNDFL